MNLSTSPAVTVTTLADAHRAIRVCWQHRALMRDGGDVEAGRRARVTHGIVGLREDPVAVEGVEPIGQLGEPGLELARARNMAGDWAAEREPDLMIFLDADCLPGRDLVEGYLRAARQHPDSVLSGPVSYLPPAETQSLEGGEVSAAELVATVRTNPHPARPAPAPGQTRLASAEEYDVFWSLSFAVTPFTWRRIREEFGGFDEQLRGYGGEDTDFGWQLCAHGIPLVWVGDAQAFHVWHPVSSPPVEHVEDIVTNANQCHEKWGRWPMLGWLREFEELGKVRFQDGKWRVM